MALTDGGPVGAIFGRIVSKNGTFDNVYIVQALSIDVPNGTFAHSGEWTG